MTGLHPAVVQLEGSNLVLVIIVAVIALAALAMAWMFRAEVLTADEGGLRRGSDVSAITTRGYASGKDDG